jgi:hypothetical protein
MVFSFSGKRHTAVCRNLSAARTVALGGPGRSLIMISPGKGVFN